LATMCQSLFGNSPDKPQGTTDCSGFNAFLNKSLDGLMYYATSISPSGLIQFDLTKSSELSGIEELHPLLEVQSSSTFVLENTTQSRLSKGLWHYKYQQYFQGIKVMDGGYTVSAMSDTPGDPCAVAYILAPNIYSEINVNANPNINANSLSSILNTESTITSELVIALNLTENCEYNLVWEARYTKEGSKISWIDAHSGALLGTIGTEAHNNAPTEIYGQQNLDDSVDGNVRNLESGNGIVTTAPGSPTVAEDFDDLIIPTNPNVNGDWTTDHAPVGVYQSHHVTTSVMPGLSSAGIEFSSIQVAYDNTYFNNARAFDDYDRETKKAYVKFGVSSDNGHSHATYDIAGHELGHNYLFDILAYKNDGPKTIHEAICDLIGIYVEADVQGFEDWIQGDDDPTLPQRDVEHPNEECWNSYTQTLDRHERAGPLRRWFYLMSHGDAANGITGVGLEKTLNLVLDAVNHVGQEDDVEEFVEATMLEAYSQFGICSNVANTLRASWAEVCIDVPPVDCSFSIIGPEIVCEEDDMMTLFASGGPGNAGTFVWYFPLGWTVPGSQGNMYTGTTLNVINLPKYNWYPRYFTITLRLLNSGIERNIKIKLEDCLGDDPSCKEFNSYDEGSFEDRSALLHTEKNDANQTDFNKIVMVRVHDATGRMLFEGSMDDLNKNRLTFTGFLIYTYFDEDNKFVKAEKAVIIK